MRPSRSRRSRNRRTHRNRRGGGDEPKPSLLKFIPIQPNPNLVPNPNLIASPPPYVHRPLYVNPNPPFTPQLQKSSKAFPHPVSHGGKRRTRRTRRHR